MIEAEANLPDANKKGVVVRNRGSHSGVKEILT